MRDEVVAADIVKVEEQESSCRLSGFHLCDDGDAHPGMRL